MQAATLEVNAAENNVLKSTVLVAGPTMVTLIPMAAAPAMPAMAAHFPGAGSGSLFAQLVMTIPAIILILVAPLAGIVAEIIGRRTVMLLGLAFFVLSGGAALFVDSEWGLIASRLLLGAAGGAIQTSSLALVSDYPSGGPRERLLGFMVAGSSTMAVVALIAGGRMVDLWGWRAPFTLYLAGIPVLLLAVFSIKSHSHVGGREHNLFAPVRLLWPVYAIAVLLTIGMFMPSIQGPFLLAQRGVTSAEVQGSVAAACALVAAVSAASYGYIVRYVSPRNLLMATAFLFGVGAIGIARLNGIVSIGSASALMGIGAGLVEASCATLIMARSPLEMRSRALGLLLSAVFFGQFLNPWVVAPLRNWFGVEGAFMAVGFLFLVLALAIGCGVGFRESRTPPDACAGSRQRH
ncbi:putative MFS family arabinose efflux permease [Paraburkholderia sp. BL18I3N2]|uniref:MFS transporter n=1 Tax=Paraburkholderia sp. BL18I3N2 TaxID=1938799 RepID=UPI000D05DF63|nr:MFS transporter [Paraburkholderia sp. BL18I3N2]PRX27326.1 putative MFS family arabinose efflux permease [Paraburkholderia sp. BL18I3N2]